MNTLFKKLEATKINVLDLLQPEDKTYCLNIFVLYNSHSSFIQNLLQTTIEAYDLHRQQTPITKDDFYYDMDKMEKQLQGLEDILTSLNETVVRKIEFYFQDGYNVTFNSFNEKQETSKRIVHCQPENIIDNIMEQVGTDLIRSGKEQVISRFQKCFGIASKQPQLKNSKILLPAFFYPRSSLKSNDISLDYNDCEMNKLLDTLALFFFDTSRQPEIFTVQIDEWKQKINLNTAYYLQGDLSIKFFKNRRIDIAFPSTHSAEKFWQMFQLENIVMINNSNE
jgi:hypothetical protein